MWYQHDGAPAHKSSQPCTFLAQTFDTRIIGYGGQEVAEATGGGSDAVAELVVVAILPMRWLGHQYIYTNALPTKKVTSSKIEGSRHRVRPPTRMLDDVEKDLKLMGINRWKVIGSTRGASGSKPWPAKGC
ncbi:hypothetical protein TNCV_2885701 [Trichonephila clavipes]|nr:hypothetical protein TNCV_2885701 [Trichonephila clavipes]